MAPTDLVDLHRADGGHDVRACGIAVVQQVLRRSAGRQPLQACDSHAQSTRSAAVRRRREGRPIQDRQLMPEREDLKVQSRARSSC